MKSIKKTILFIGILSVLAVCMLFSASAETYGDYEYSVYSDTEVVINSYTGRDENLVIPSVIDGKNVVAIGYGAFEGLYSVKSVVIPDTVTYIGQRAFQFSNYIENVTIGSGVSEIGSCAFGFCYSLKNITVSEANEHFSSEDGILYNKDKTRLIQYNIASERTTFNIPSGVVEIASNSFMDADNLVNVAVPDTVTTIETDAFWHCRYLENMLIPTSVTTFMGGDLFYDIYNSKLKNIYYKGTQQQWQAIVKWGEYSIVTEDDIKVQIHYNYEGDHFHDNDFIVLKPATCTVKGEKENTCKICGYKSKEEIPVSEHTVVIDKAVAATYTSTGLTEGSHCSVCNTVIEKQEVVPKLVAKPDTTKPADTTKPSVNGSDKTETVTAKKPAKVKIKSAKSTKKKRAVITWALVKTANGYEVSYSTSKKFSKKVTKKAVIKKAKTTKTTLKKLKSGKKYFVKVRAYKTVEGKKLYGSWSKVKTVKVK